MLREVSLWHAVLSCRVVVRAHTWVTACWGNAGRHSLHSARTGLILHTDDGVLRHAVLDGCD